MVGAKQALNRAFINSTGFIKKILVITLIGVIIFLSFSHSVVSVLGQNAPQFSDIGSSWARDEILKLAQVGIISGFPDGTFRPGNPVSRAEFAKMVVSSFASPSESPPSFKDVSQDFWASRYISGAQVMGWITGFPDGTFRPQEPVTRAQALAVLARIAGWKEEVWPYPIPPSSWATGTVAAALKNGVIRENEPYWDLSYQFADQACERQEVAAFLERMLEKVRPALFSSVEVAGQTASIALDEKATFLLGLINKERANAGLNSLEWDSTLADFAQKYATEMGTNEFFSHVSPISGSFQERAKVLFDQGFTFVGENLARVNNIGSFTTEALLSSIHNSFMNSPTHRDNIMNPNWTSVGIGFWSDGNWLYLEVCFGTR
ncbi:MAG: S-layer homology domain-containing protein [Caldiserica bacterium]|nr:S-layer homology domain-containing protein [Caldisericota bacterium]